MVGMCGMGPEPVPIDDEEERKRIEERYERIGLKIVNRASGMRESGDPLPAILSDPYKRAAAAQILGQAYITALCLIRHNRESVLHVAERLIDRKELHGDEVVELLDSVALEAPVIDVRDETIWPKL
jgi:hypothetical protein